MTMRPHGFTLIELMVALAIFGFLIMLAGPQLATFLANSQVRNAAESVYNGVQRAQGAAIVNNAPARLVLDKTVGTGGWEIHVVDPSDGTVPAPDPASPCGVRANACAGGNTCNPVQLFCAKDGAADAAFTPNPPDATTITFDAYGRVQCNTDDTLACDGSKNLQWVDVTNSKNNQAQKLRVCITGQQAPVVAGKQAATSGSVPMAASQLKLCDPNPPPTNPQAACPATCN